MSLRIAGVGAAGIVLSTISANAATLSGTSAPAFQQEAVVIGSFPTGAPHSVRVHQDASNITQGVYEFALPTLPVGGSYTSVNLNYYVMETISNGGSTSSLTFFGYGGNGRYDIGEGSATQLAASGPITTLGQKSTTNMSSGANGIAGTSKSPWLGVVAWQSSTNATTGLSRGTLFPGPSLSYTANVPDSGTLSTRAMVDAQATLNSGVYTVDQGSMSGTVINTQQSLSGTVDRRGILEFNLGGLPAGATITSASLAFDINGLTSSTDNGGPEPRVYGYNGDGLSTAADAGQTLNLIATGSEVTSFGDYVITLNPASVQAMLGTNNIVGLLMRGSADGNQFAFYTSDSTNPNNVPVTLNVTYAVPEPGTSALAILSTAGLLLRRRRGPLMLG